MTIRDLAIVAACACASVTAYAATSPKAPDQRPASYPLPAIKADCTSCHTGGGPALKTTLSGLCLDCHKDRLAASEHKVDIVPTMNVQGLPLTGGKMTCFTCHDPHRNPYGSLLRKPETELCRTCHPY